MTNPREDSPSTLWRNERRRFLEDAEDAHQLLKRVNSEGNHLLALEIAEEILADRVFDDAVPVLQQMARALAVLGSSHEALAVLDGIAPGRDDEAETLGLLARVWKDLAGAAEDRAEAGRCFSESFGCYAKGFDIAVLRGDAGGAAYCGINAAAVAVWLGEMDAARDFAAKASAHAANDSTYYGIATRAEAALILGEDTKAETLYKQASEIGEAGKRWADIASTRKQCRALCQKIHSRRDRMDGCFTHGSVAVISCQAPEPHETLPAGLIESVRKRAGDWLGENGIRHAFLGEENHWDNVVAEVAKGLGIEVHAITVAEGGRVFAERMVAARGALLASHLGVAVKALAIGDKPAMTAAADWKKAALAPYMIFPAGGQPDGVAEQDVTANPVPFPRTVGAEPKERVLALLHLRFAEGKSPTCGELDLLSAALAATSAPPITREGFAGDYLFAFSELRHAALLALDFIAALQREDHAHSSICLHTGPVSMQVNPVLHLHAPHGEAVVRAGVIAARLPAGSICATETFTALCTLESLRGFRFEHSGIIAADGKSDRLFRLLPTTRP